MSEVLFLIADGSLGAAILAALWRYQWRCAEGSPANHDNEGES